MNRQSTSPAATLVFSRSLLPALLAAAIVAAIASAVLAACTSPTPVASDAPSASTAVQPQAPATPRAQIGAFGLDLAGGDASVKPGDNFYRYAGGTWLQNNPIPPDRTLWDTFQILASKSEIAVRDLIEDLAKQPDPNPVDRKIADYYRAFMDEAAIKAAGLKPIAQDLERMTKARTKAELLSAAADPPILGRLPINAYVGLDPRNPDRYIAFVLHAGLGLPDRCRQRRAVGGAGGLSTVTARQAGPGSGQSEWRGAFLPVLGAGVSHADS
jgi:hypothetical protein